MGHAGVWWGDGRCLFALAVGRFRIDGSSFDAAGGTAAAAAAAATVAREGVCVSEFGGVEDAKGPLVSGFVHDARTRPRTHGGRSRTSSGRRASRLAGRIREHLGPARAGFDAATIQQLEQGDLSQFPNLEAVDEGPRRAGRVDHGVEGARRHVAEGDWGGAQRAAATPVLVSDDVEAGQRHAGAVQGAAVRAPQGQGAVGEGKEIHKNKMGSHTHQSFDPEYAAQYRAEKAARQFANAKRRKTALLIARRIAERDNQPRPLTPPLPEDSSDEESPRHATPGSRRARWSADRRAPCDRCKSRGIVCEITRDLEDPKAAPPAWKLKEAGGARYDEDEEEEEEEDEPVATEEERADVEPSTTERQSRDGILEQQAVHAVQGPSAALRDGERPCGTCSFKRHRRHVHRVVLFPVPAARLPRGRRVAAAGRQRGGLGHDPRGRHTTTSTWNGEIVERPEAPRGDQIGPGTHDLTKPAVIQESSRRAGSYVPAAELPQNMPHAALPAGARRPAHRLATSEPRLQPSLAPTGADSPPRPSATSALLHGMISTGNGTTSSPGDRAETASSARLPTTTA
ncbi:hypothetical protein EYC84_000612 [Monilinia fructicola]|uniref:Uncharacterized protein n=1 Tax=Monilinia fructicola TaxID=38448 RepID=A0A5M9JTA1_MONFR|nr:hypothetical protein EYC84_000612 [Monilinia fructicola]